MTNIRSKDTGPEIWVRKKLHNAGFRFRLHKRDLPGKPDIVLRRYKLAIFVNGCFWHGHHCRLAKLPETNSEFWSEKISKNIERDHANVSSLKAMGWEVREIWTCRLEKDTESILRFLEDRKIRNEMHISLRFCVSR
jgi:DNA mismatch endonuclease (patch repair protein)